MIHDIRIRKLKKNKDDLIAQVTNLDRKKRQRNQEVIQAYNGLSKMNGTEIQLRQQTRPQTDHRPRPETPEIRPKTQTPNLRPKTQT